MAITDAPPKSLESEHNADFEAISSQLDIIGTIPNVDEVRDEPLLKHVSHQFDVTLDGPNLAPTYENDSQTRDFSAEDLQDIHDVLLPSVLLVDADVHTRHPRKPRRYNVVVNGGITGKDPWEGRIVSNRLPHTDDFRDEIYIAAFGGSTLVWVDDFEVPRDRSTPDKRLDAKQNLINDINARGLQPQSAADGEVIRLDKHTVHASCEDEIIGKSRLVIFVTPEDAGVPKAPVTQSQM